MSKGLSVEHRGDLIVITHPGASFSASYRRETRFPGFTLHTETTEPGADLDSIRQFQAAAYGAALQKARELGWIVADGASALQ
jgi:hypothetical protein